MPDLDRLRKLAIVNPKEGREAIQGLAEAGDLAPALHAMAGPGDGRLRQLVAVALRGHGSLDSVRESLEGWLEVESDEFTRKAIRTTLDGPAPKERKGSARSQGEPEVFAYLAGRMRHELRNGLTQPAASLRRLKEVAAELEPGAVRSKLVEEVGRLEDGLRRVGRLLEMQELDEAHFAIRTVDLIPWLSHLHNEYVSAYSPIRFVGLGSGRVVASDYLLRTVFWNLWQNAHRLVGPECEIRLSAEVGTKWITVIVADNGPGFRSDQVDLMFEANVSGTAGRGRGLLEIREAVDRLGGKAEPFRDADGSHRIRLRLVRAKE